MYWIGRYVERAENTARVLEVTLQLLGDFEGYVDGREAEFWRGILRAAGCLEAYTERYGEAYESDRLLTFLAFDGNNVNSIANAVGLARENTRAIRDQVSHEMFACINALYHDVQGGAAAAQDAFRAGEVLPYAFFEQVKLRSHQFIGLLESSYFHEEGYRFIQTGKYIERADQTARMLDFKALMDQSGTIVAGGAVDTAGWVAVLRSCSALDSYHGLQAADLGAASVVEFLFLSPYFPRSVRFCLQEMDRHLRGVRGTERGEFGNEAERLSGQLCSELQYQTVEGLLGGEEGLHGAVEALQTRLDSLNAAIAGTYFQC